MTHPGNLSTRTPILLSLLTLIIACIALVWLNGSIDKSHHKELELQVKLLHNEQNLDKILDYDEALTMSAMMFIQTNDDQWADRYEKLEELYKADIKKIIAQKTASLQTLGSILTERRTLSAIEKEAFRVKRSGIYAMPIALLQSSEYSNKKASFEKAINSTIKAVQDQHYSDRKQYEMENIFRKYIRLAVFIVLVLILLIQIIVFQKWRNSILRIIDHDKSLITKLQEAEDNYSKSNDQRNMLLKSSSAIIFCVKATGDFDPIYISDNIEEVLGYSKSEFFSPNFWVSNLHPEEIQDIFNLFPKMYESGILSFQYRFRKKNGSWRWMQADLKVVYDEQANPIELTGTWWDISKEKESQEAIQLSSERLELAFKATHDIIYDWDLITNTLWWSEEMFRSFGHETANINDVLTWEENIHPEDHDEIMHSVAQAITNNEDSWSGNYRFRLADNTYADIIDRGYIIYNANKQPVRWIGSMSDITTLKKAEAELKSAVREAKETAQAKSEFLANMSHEIRTPLNGIVGMTELALETELDDDQQRYLNIVKISCDTLMTLINDILDFSKIDAGKLEITPVPFSIRDEFPLFMQPLGLKATNKKLELVLSIHDDVPDLVIGDLYRLQQIINNLAGNAIKFTDSGEIKINIQLETLTDGRGTLLFSVSDTGIGIHKNKLNKIFEEFTQADSGTTRRFGGTGLGLTISKRLSELMGGSIWVESEEFKGSTFYFTTIVTLQNEQRQISSFPVLENTRVLVVEDNGSSRKLILHILENFGMKPLGVASGEEAIEELEKGAYLGQAYPLILLDLSLSGKLDGFDVAEYVHEHMASTKIIVVSMSQKASDRERLALLGANKYFTKPFSQSDLLDCIQNTLIGDTKLVSNKNRTVKANSPASKINPIGHYKILLVEDNLVNQEVACSMLNKRGHEIIIANNGLEAVALYKKEHFDIILMDIQMPFMNGYEATENIRGIEENGKHTPIIGLTANAMNGDREKCLNAGMDAYISKPVRMNELFSVLEKVQQKADQTKNIAFELEEVKSLVNLKPLMEILDDDIEIVKEILKHYETSAIQYVKTIQVHVKNSNFVGMAFSAHSLKGQSMYVGAQGIVDLANKIEILAMQKNLSELIQLADLLETELIGYLGLLEKSLLQLEIEQVNKANLNN